MNKGNQLQIDCSNLRKAINRVAASDATAHLGNAFREVLLAARSAVNAVIESREQRPEAKLQKVTIE